MEITLQDRTEQTVSVYFQQTNNELFHRLIPQKAQTVEEAISDYRKTMLPGARSYGHTVWVDGQYVGDVWCYGIDPTDTPNAMLSYCLFATDYWQRGIATEAVRLFLQELQNKFAFSSIGAFTFADNLASVRVLEKNRFLMQEAFTEDGRESKYFEYRF